MALGTYGDLKSSVASWLHRTDLTAEIADFVALAESDIRHDVRCQAMEQRTTGVLTGETLAHPDRFIQARQLLVGGYQHYYRTPEEYEAARVIGDDELRIFTSIGQSLYINGGTSGDSYTLVYYQGFAPFSGDSDTNWLLTNVPEVYLSSVLAHAFSFTMDEQNAIKHKQLYLGAANRLKMREQVARFAGPLNVRPSTLGA